MASYRILSFDCGGIRGLLSLILLERLEKALPGWLDKADLLAGTSTGGIIALGLAHGVTVAELRRLYEDCGKLVFDYSWWDDLCDLGKTRGADYLPTLGSSGAASKTKKLADSRKSRRSVFAKADGQRETEGPQQARSHSGL